MELDNSSAQVDNVSTVVYGTTNKSNVHITKILYRCTVMSFFSKLSKTVDNTFNTITRINNDVADETQRSVQNAHSGSYNTENFYANDCTMKKPIKLATTQPSIFYKGGHSLASGGCNVDDSSNLLIGGAALSKSKCKLTLHPREYLTVPYLGRGETDITSGESIRYGETSSNRKSHRPDSEISYQPFHMYPLLPELQENVQNPSHIVEEVAADGWVRGGIPSREIIRQME